MVGQSLAAWIGLPALLVGTSGGLGLLVERVSRTAVPTALLLPVGWAAQVVLAVAAYKAGFHGVLTAAVVLALALAGVLAGRRGLRGRLRPGPSIAVALLVYGLYIGPTLLTGTWGWTGYNFLNDTAAQMLLADHLREFGLTIPANWNTSTSLDLLHAYIGTSYPMGTHADLGMLAEVVGSVAACYTTFVASMAAIGAIALAHLARRAGVSALAAVAAGTLAMGASLAYQYALQGSIKEIGMIAALAVVAATARELHGARHPARAAIPLGIATAAAISIYSAAALPYVAVSGACVLLLLVAASGLPRWRSWLRPAGTAAIVGIVAAIPTLLTLVSFLHVANSVFGAGGSAPAGASLGQLARPLPVIQAGGVWLTGDYRFGPPGQTANTLTLICVALVAALVVVGGVASVLRREPGPLLFFLPAAITVAVSHARLSPYANAKLLAILTPSVVFLASYGLWCLTHPSRRVVLRWVHVVAPKSAALLAVLLGAGVLASDAMGYHWTKVAPVDRMNAIGDLDGRLRGEGPILFNEFEEFAPYFMRHTQVNVAFEGATPRIAALRDPSQAPVAHYFDLDQERLSYVVSFPTIVLRSSPSASRPPLGYRRVYTNRYYVVWHRSSPNRVIDHMPLQSLGSSTDTPRCADVRRLAQEARRRNGWLVAASAPAVAALNTARAPQRSPGWIPQAGMPGRVVPVTPGQASGRIRVPDSGRYAIWAEGSYSRRTNVQVDGRTIGTVKAVNTPGQWLGAGTISLRRGPHRVAIVRPGGSLAPGDGAPMTIGPVAFQRVARERLRRTAAGRWHSLCGRPWDWIEVVEP